MFPMELRRSQRYSHSGHCTMNVTHAVNPAVRSTIKRLTDLTIAVFGLIFLVPLFAMIALLVYMSLGRPVIFRQVRVGYRRKSFHDLQVPHDARDPAGR